MIDVYVARLPQSEGLEPLSCAERQKDIEKISNERVRREKYYVWKLLEYAVKKSLGADASRLNFTKGENQRWTSDACEFSLSHSGEAIAVAISNKAVGVDVERIRVRSTERMSEYILTERERDEYANIAETDGAKWLMIKWCEKEAIFKSQNKDSFAPSKIETSRFFCNLSELTLGGEPYILVTAASENDDVRVVEVLDF